MHFLSKIKNKSDIILYQEVNVIYFIFIENRSYERNKWSNIYIAYQDHIKVMIPSYQDKDKHIAKSNRIFKENSSHDGLSNWSSAIDIK